MNARIAALALLAAALAAPLTAHGQPAAYPSKPIRLIVPFAAGGGADIVARPFVLKLGERLGQSIIYENRGGAGGILAGEIVARAAPDGYTLLLGAVSVMTVTVNLMKMPFDPARDFTPITNIAAVPSMLAARAGFPHGTLKAIVDYARSNPRKLTWAVSGVGSGGHLAMERFRLDLKLDVVAVFFKGAGPASIALVSNEADVMFANPGVFMPHLKSGRLRAIAAAGVQRIGVLPDLPTFAEAGFPGYENASWYGLVAPARAPAAVVTRLYEESRKVLSDPDLVAIFARDGAIPVGNTPAAFGQDIRNEIAQSAKIIKAANIRLQP